MECGVGAASVEGPTSLMDHTSLVKPQGNWREISVEIDALGSAVKEKTNTWTKRCKESAKRES